MSMLMAEARDGELMLCSDSRMSVERDGIFYAIDDNFKKLFVVDGSNIIWVSGSAWIGRTVAEKFKQLPRKSIGLFLEVAQQQVEQYTRMGGTCPDPEVGFAQLMLAQASEEEVRLYLTGDAFGWRYVEHVASGDPVPVFGGSGCDVGRETYLKFRETLSFKEVAQKAFDLASCESIGGTLHIATLSTSGILEESHPISDAGKAVRRIRTLASAKAFYDLQGKPMLTSDYKFSPEFLEPKGLIIPNPNDASKPYFECSETSGRVQMNDAVVSGDITMLGGSIAWDKVNSDPMAVGAASTASSAYSRATNAQSVANEALNITGTIIDGTQVISPQIVGGTVEGAVLNVNGAIAVPGKSLISEFAVYDGDDKYGYIRFDDKGAGQYQAQRRMFVCTEDGKALKIQSGENLSIDANGVVFFGSDVVFGEDVVFGGDVEFKGSVTGLPPSTAVFG